MEQAYPLLNEEELDRGFTSLVKSFPGLDGILRCIQCGTCSGSCQLSKEMDYTPRRIIEMIRAGMRDEVLGSKAIWYCASCYMCTVRCPSNIKVTEVMYALKSLALKRGFTKPKDLSPTFYSTFIDVSKAFGRMDEMQLMLRFGFKTNVMRLVKLGPFGAKLFFKGRINVVPKRLKNMREFKRLLKAAQEMGMGK